MIPPDDAYPDGQSSQEEPSKNKIPVMRGITPSPDAASSHFVRQIFHSPIDRDTCYDTKAPLSKNTHAQPRTVPQVTRRLWVILSSSVRPPIGMNRRCSGGCACVKRFYVTSSNRQAARDTSACAICLISVVKLSHSQSPDN